VALGLSVASRSGLPAARFAEFAAAAEGAGFSSFFVAERVADSFALCQAALAATSKLQVGTAVANARLRHPALTAMSAAAMDEQSGGRFVLGLGIANPALNETALGLPAVRPVGFMREYVAGVRSVLRGGGVALDRAPARSELPIMLAGLQPRMLRLAGEVADGVLLNLTTPATLASALSAVSPRPGFTVACVLPCSVGGDRQLARRTGQQLVAGYALHPAASRLFAASGYAEQLAEVARLLGAGDRAAALAQVGDDLIDDFLLRGERDQVLERIERYRAAGVDLPILFPVGGGEPASWADAVKRTIGFVADLGGDRRC
jgi:5,10-methylenetetrahydromethanopterin reductase